MIDFENGQGPVKVADFYRVEAELKAVDGFVLPWPMLSDPDPFLLEQLLLCGLSWRGSTPAKFNAK